ncbi:DUF6083 domain-containing protein [Kitasatospora cathayae]|uniref:DUF6083 domain-containing protein n=1 Tax=Kitasatospora cathayae TaxID=3004092 RepID=A0ABY7QF44_9ACTN|nr:DUF6083 domain-containing protein [Kitasatospora sp. HUAS 3-15]WBP91366.1 DUF6083 domain-containing protein [Kitasatospora sp. HUAS 3-15]
MAEPRCDECRSVGTARPRNNDPYMVICDDCWPDHGLKHGLDNEPTDCERCGGPNGRWNGYERAVLCRPCQIASEREPDPSREPRPIVDVLDGLLDAMTIAEDAHMARTAAAAAPAVATTTTCGHCGATAQWFMTRSKKWVLLEPGVHPTYLIPEGNRWRIDQHNTALNIGRANPTDRCRVCHWDVCPGRVPAPSSPHLLSLWKDNDLHRRQSD